MRPTLPESIAGIRDILERVVGPEVTSEYARIRFNDVILALRTLENSAPAEYPRLWRERERLQALVDSGRMLAANAAEPTRSELGALLSESAVESAPKEGLPPYAWLNDETARLKSVVARAVETLSRSGESDPGLVEFRAQIRAYIAASVASAPAPTSQRLATIGSEKE